MKNHRLMLAAPLALLVIVITLVASCERTPPAGVDDDSQVLNRALSADPESLDPQRARSTQAADVLRDIGEGLTAYSHDGVIEPAGATGWQISDDGLVYRFTLREAARWSDGSPVVAQHYVMALQRLVDPATASLYANQLDGIESAPEILAGEAAPAALGVSAPDPLTLEIRLRQPTPYLLSLLSHPSTFPVHPAALAEHGDAYARPGNLPSNGPYRLVDWQPASLLTLERNTAYWDNANTAIDRVRHHVIPQEMVELNRFRAGELDITTNVAPEGFAQARIDFPDELRVAPNLGVYYYGFNLTKPPFKDNPDLRQALSMAVDRETLVETITGRGEAPAYSWVPPGVDNYEPPQLGYANMSQTERNAIARSLYSKAGYSEDEPLKIELRYNTSDSHRRIALAVASMWTDVLGVETELVNEEFQVLIANMQARDVTQVFRSSWSGDFNDAITFLAVLEPGAAMNFPGYDSAEYAELLARAAAQVDPDRRRLFLEEAERVMLADHPVIPLYFYVSKHLVSQRVQGWGDNVLDYHYSHHLSLTD